MSDLENLQNQESNMSDKELSKKKEEVQNKHRELTEKTKKAYSNEKIVNIDDKVKDIFLPQAQKRKHIQEIRYENGVVKRRLVGLEKAVGGGAWKQIVKKKKIEKTELKDHGKVVRTKNKLKGYE